VQFQFNIDTCFTVGQVYAKYFFLDLSKPLVITFGTAGSLVSQDDVLNASSPWGFDFIKGQGLNVLSFSSLKPASWYRETEFLDFLTSLHLPHFPQLLGYGSSMGGFGVSAFANLLKFDRVLLINPISTLNKNLAPWETRFENAARRLDWNTGAFDGSTIKCNGLIVYDPICDIDSKHARRYGAHMQRLKIFGVGHAVPEHLKNMGVLSSLLKNFLNDTIDAALVHKQFRARRNILRNYNWLLSKENSHLTPARESIIRRYRTQFLQTYQPKHGANLKSVALTSDEVDLLRDAAVKLEKIDLIKAHKLMSIAAKYRKGPYILKKVKEYEAAINLKAMQRAKRINSLDTDLAAPS